MTMLERLRVRLPGVQDELLAACIEDASASICAYTGRAAVPEGLSGVQVRLAVVYYNRMGIEGETAHAQGGVSRSMESMPADIAAQLRPHRLARVVSMHATEGA